MSWYNKDIKIEPTEKPDDNGDQSNDAPETVTQTEKTNAPKTGDYMNSIAMIWMIIMAMTCIGIVVVVKCRRKSE